MVAIPDTALSDIASFLKHARSELEARPCGVDKLAEEQAFRRQALAWEQLQAWQQSRGDIDCGKAVVPPRPASADEDGSGKAQRTVSQQDLSAIDASPSAAGSETPMGSPLAESVHMQFVTKEDLARMRYDMKEKERNRQRESARRKADIEADCPLFLSLPMRRMLEMCLPCPPTGMEDALGHSIDGGSLREGTAKVVAALTILNRVPPCYVQHFLRGKLAPVTTSEIEGLYEEVLDHMRRELRNESLGQMELTYQLSAQSLAAVCRAALEDGTGSVTSRSFRAGRYGVANIANQEMVVSQRTRADERGPPRTWFGLETADADDYTFRKQMSVDLPIAQKKDEICQLIRHNQVVLVQGETGCGKTTQVPQYILEMACNLRQEQKRPIRIVVTQPRRIAAITVAKRVAEELGEKVGEGVVGYKIRGTTVAGPKCKILFCTTGVVLRRLANEGQLHMFSPKTVTYLLVDEIHERGVETDFMLTFLKQVQGRRPNLRVILMSATMDAACFQKYFTRAQDGGDVVPPMVHCTAFCHPVEEVYLEAVNTRLGRSAYGEAKSPDELRRAPNEQQETDGIDYDLILQTVEEIEQCPEGAWTFCESGARTRSKDPSKGAVLIFLPGLGEISEMMSKMEEGSKLADRWWVLALHAGLPPEEQQTCFQTQLPEGKTRKIICATNVAETSVTVPDVTVVIDTCRERRNQVDRYSNTPILKEQWCAKDSLKQRRGRAGRVQPGVCFRFIPEQYKERLDTTTPPEMQRVPLENVYLQVCASGIADRKAFLAKTPDPPSDASVQFAEAALEELGALDPSEPDGLTPLGRHLAALPCHPRLGKILVLSCLLGVPGAGLSITAAMSTRNPLLTTQSKEKREAWQQARMELVQTIGARSDHCVWAHILQEWRAGSMRQRDFCKKYGLSYERMCAAMFERKHLCEALVQVGLLPDTYLREEYTATDLTQPDWTLVSAAVVGGLYPNIIRVEKSAPRHQSNSPSEKAKWLRYSMLQRHYNKDQEGYPKSLNLHPNSLCFGQDQYHYPWLAFYTIQHTTKLYAYDVTEVSSPFALFLFGAAPQFKPETMELQVGSWARFKCPSGPSLLPLILEARRSIQDVLLRKLDDPTYDPMTSQSLRACIALLRTNGLGFRRPSPERVDRCHEQEEDEDRFDELALNETAWMLKKDKEREDCVNAAFKAAIKEGS